MADFSWFSDEQWSWIEPLLPTVLLSACDTHATDRNHATVANGFLMLGARSVIGSVFPLHATHAAIFAARLLYRVSEFIPAAVKTLGRSITWLEVVSGMLRRQALTDILRHLEEKASLPRTWSIEATAELQMLVDVSSPQHSCRLSAMLKVEIDRRSKGGGESLDSNPPPQIPQHTSYAALQTTK